MADSNHPLAIKFLHHYGFVTRSDVTSRFVGLNTIGDVGRADIFCTLMGATVNIEVKFGAERFKHHPTWDKKKGIWKGGWHWKQRRWAMTTMCHPVCAPYWIFLTMGKDPANYNPEKYMPKRSWLIPFHVMHPLVVEIEQAGIKSFPYKVKKGGRKVYAENGWDAHTMFAGYELEWAKTGSLVRPEWFGETAGKPYDRGFFILPENHPFQKHVSLDSTIDVECHNEKLDNIKGMYDELIKGDGSPVPQSEQTTRNARSRRRGSRKQKQAWQRRRP